MQKIIFINLLFGIFLIIGSCIDPFTIELEEGQVFLVVDGEFTPEKRPHLLELYYTNSQVSRRRTPTEGATIELVSGEGERELYTEIDKGIYQLKGEKIEGEENGEYFVKIKLVNGAEYQSVPAKMPRQIKGDSAYIRFNFLEETLITGAITKTSFLEVFVDSPLPQNDSDYWLKWEVSTLYSFPEIMCGPLGPPPDICFIPGKNDPQQLMLLNGERFGNGRVERLKVNEKRLVSNNFEYRGRHYFLVNQQSINKETYDYWEKVNRVANQTGSIFDAPPAGIPGNIYNVNDPEEMVLGYFELTHTDSLRAYITAGELSNDFKFPTLVCPTSSSSFFEFFRECCDCTRIENSTLNRPAWF